MGAIKFPSAGSARRETKTDPLLNSCPSCALLLLRFYEYKPQTRLEQRTPGLLGYLPKILIPALNKPARISWRRCPSSVGKTASIIYNERSKIAKGDEKE